MSKSGRLDARVIIQRRVESQDSFGEVTWTWENVVTLWAQIAPLRGEEFLAAQQVQSKVDTRIRVRYFEGLRTQMRAVQRVEEFDQNGTAIYRVYAIEAVLPEGRKDFMLLMCAQRESEGFRAEKITDADALALDGFTGGLELESGGTLTLE